MLFHDLFCVCFLALLAPNVDTNAKLDSETTKPEALFADVIKNISRVNDELQNLIKSYEQFKKTYDSQENFDVHKEVASDAEGGRINRNSENYKKKSSDQATTSTYQTEMIYEDEEADKNSGNSKSSEVEKSSQIQFNNEVEKSSQIQSNSEVEQSNEEESKKSKENIDQNKQKLQTTTTEISISKEVSTHKPHKNDESEPESDDFVNIHQSLKTRTDRLKRILTNEYPEPNNTKYVEDEKQTKYLEGIPQPSESDISAEDKQHTEAEEEKITAKKRQDRAFGEIPSEFTTVIYLRSSLTENTTRTKKPQNASLESSDSDEDLSKDVFKTNVLREAYGDACAKLVIRRCYKACLSASKFSCRAAFKCKSEFKNYFKSKAKTACIDAFNASSLRRISDSVSVDGAIMTPQGYLSVACQSPTSRRKNLENVKNSNSTKNHTVSLNILRDKYEKACAKISQKRCTMACHHSVQQSCYKYECKKSMKKNFNKHCKRSCKKAYLYKSKERSDSDSDSSDSDDSDSDDSGSDDSDSSDSDSSSSDSSSDSSHSKSKEKKKEDDKKKEDNKSKEKKEDNKSKEKNEKKHKTKRT